VGRLNRVSFQVKLCWIIWIMGLGRDRAHGAKPHTPKTLYMDLMVPVTIKVSQ
jgi:hypothetical protein